MILDLSHVDTIVTQYESEVKASAESCSSNSNPFLEILNLQKIRQDLPRLLRVIQGHKSNRAYQSLSTRVYELSALVEDGLHEHNLAFKSFIDKYGKQEVVVDSDTNNSTSVLGPTASETGNDNYASLRKRLLADGASTSLDNNENASSEQMNTYHETFQEDLLGDLTTLASSLKSSAQALSAKITDDATLVAETSENMMKSSTLMSSVGSNLNAYLSEKTGGKITIFFMIKTMAFVFILFFIMVVITKILPKM